MGYVKIFPLFVLRREYFLARLLGASVDLCGDIVDPEKDIIQQAVSDGTLLEYMI